MADSRSIHAPAATRTNARQRPMHQHSVQLQHSALHATNGLVLVLGSGAPGPLVLHPQPQAPLLQVQATQGIAPCSGECASLRFRDRSMTLESPSKEGAGRTLTPPPAARSA